MNIGKHASMFQSLSVFCHYCFSLFYHRYSNNPPFICIIELNVVFPTSETDQRAHHEGEHEDGEPSGQHEEEPRSADHSMYGSDVVFL